MESTKHRDDDEGETELNQLSDVYSVLKRDAKVIIFDLKGGVMMWREAASSAAATVGFIVILILTSFRFYPPGNSIEGWAYIIGSGIVAVIMAVISAIGFRKYYQLKKKYSSLFERAKNL